MFSSKYGKCQSGSISATPSAEMNSVEMTFAIAVSPSGQGVSAGRPAQNPKLIGRRKIRPDAEPEFRARRDAPAKTAPGHPPAPDPGRRAAVAYRPVAAGTQTRPASRAAPPGPWVTPAAATGTAARRGPLATAPPAAGTAPRVRRPAAPRPGRTEIPAARGARPPGCPQPPHPRRNNTALPPPPPTPPPPPA